MSCDHQVTWKLMRRSFEPKGNVVLALGLTVTYLDRVCDLNISLVEPATGKTTDSEIALGEIFRLRDALNQILSENPIVNLTELLLQI